jgi:hypothetical protein
VEGFEDSPTTAKIDKGKGKAELEPDEPEKVLSPRIRISDSEDEDEDGVPYEDALHPLIGKSFFLRPRLYGRLKLSFFFLCL